MAPACSDIRAASSGFVRRTLQDLLAHIRVLSLLGDDVLSRDVKVAQAPLQRRSLVEGAASTQRKTPVCHASAGGHDPRRGLRCVEEKTFAPERSGQCVIPMVSRLHLVKRLRRPGAGGNPAKFELERRTATGR